MKHVYVIGRDDGAHKVGVSVNPKSRMGALLQCSGHEMELVFTSDPLPDPYDVEGWAHDFLRWHCLGGEWFSVTADVAIGAVNRAIATWDLYKKQLRKIEQTEVIEARIGRRLARAEVLQLEASGEFGPFWMNRPCPDRDAREGGRSPA